MDFAHILEIQTSILGLHVKNKPQVLNALIGEVIAVVETVENQAILVDEQLLSDLCGETVPRE